MMWTILMCSHWRHIRSKETAREALSRPTIRPMWWKAVSWKRKASRTLRMSRTVLWWVCSRTDALMFLTLQASSERARRKWSVKSLTADSALKTLRHDRWKCHTSIWAVTWERSWNKLRPTMRMANTARISRHCMMWFLWIFLHTW